VSPMWCRFNSVAACPVERSTEWSMPTMTSPGRIPAASAPEPDTTWRTTILPGASASSTTPS